MFHPIRPFLQPALRVESIQVLDLGCGTGLVAESFLKFYSHDLSMYLADPDAAMLEESRKKLSRLSQVQSFFCTSSESIPLPDVSLDFILIGSAWHWMNSTATITEIQRVLKPGGGVYVFEYQFPKTIEYAELNNWIRIQFNSEWKPSTQKPRGSLKEITECWRVHPQFSQSYSGVVMQERLHDSHELAGVIISQSRYQHYEQSFPETEKTKIRHQLERKLDEFLSGSSGSFRYDYEGYFFKKRL